MPCPTDLELEQWLLSPERASTTSHLAECAQCQSQLRVMKQQAAHFQQYVYPRSIDNVIESTTRSWFEWSRWRWWMPVSVVAVAALLLVLRPLTPPTDYLGMKGSGALGLSVFTNTVAGAVELKDGDRVSAVAPLRFRVRTAKPCFLWMVSVDAAGSVSVLYPAGAQMPERIEGSQALPGGAVLDGIAGPERIFALCTAEPLSFDSVKTRFVPESTGEAGLRGQQALRDLPPSALQNTVLLEKAP